MTAEDQSQQAFFDQERQTDKDQSNIKNQAAILKEKTQREYILKAESAIWYSTNLRTTDPEEPGLATVTEIVNDFIERSNLAQSTKAVTRSALLWYIKHSGRLDQNEDTAQAIKILEGIQFKADKNRKPLVAKTIPPKDLNQLLAHLSCNPRRLRSLTWKLRAATWLRAGLVTGLRPIEWLSAQWTSPEKTHLQVETAKVKLTAPAFSRSKITAHTADHETESSTADAAKGAKSRHRLIPVDNDDDRSIIDQHMKFMNEYIDESLADRRRPQKDRNSAFESYHMQCRARIWDACQAIWKGKKSYGLYTMRGQFSANMKALKGPDATAELLGHSSADSPSAAHYGKRNQAHPAFGSNAPRTPRGPQMIEGQTEAGKAAIE